MTGGAPGIIEERPHLIPLDALLAVLFSISLVFLTLSFESLADNPLLWETICFLAPALVILAVRQSFCVVFTPLVSPPRVVLAALFLLLSATLIGLGTSGIIDNLFDVSELSAEIQKEISAYPFHQQVFLFAVLPAVCEEVLFRGVILNSLKSMGKRTAIILTSLLFAIFHASLELLIPIFVVSLALTVIGYTRGGLILAVLCHFLHNFINLLLMRFVEGDLSLAPALAVTAGGILAVVFSFRYFLKEHSSVEEKI